MGERKCIDCEEMTLNPERCRDCDIAWCLDEMQCSVCERMRYRYDHTESTAFAASLWGERCQCEPRPPSVYEARLSPATKEG